MASKAKTKRKAGSNAGSAMKEAHALRRELAKYGVTTVEELQAKMAGLVAEVPVDPTPAPIEIAAPPPDDNYDDLWWITPDTYEVHLVCRKRGITLRPAREKLQPPLEGIMLKSYGEGAWETMPFSLRDENHEKQRFLRIKYSRWLYYCVTRELAEDMFSDPRWPVPNKAVLSHEEFKGWSRASKRATGKHREIENPDVLREAVRRILQRGAGAVFVNARYHQEMSGGDYRIANPYGNFLDEVSLPVVKTYPKGIIQSAMPEIGTGR